MAHVDVVKTSQNVLEAPKDQTFGVRATATGASSLKQPTASPVSESTSTASSEVMWGSSSSLRGFDRVLLWALTGLNHSLE